MKRSGWWCALFLLGACASAEDIENETSDESEQVTQSLRQDFEGRSLPTQWREGRTYGGLRVRFNGYGSVGIVRDESRVLRLAPMASRTAEETHAALVTSSARFSSVSLSVRMRTVQPLRVGTPNPWEVGWVLWNYQDNQHFYYFMVKENGWELGKADPAYPGAQRFLATGPEQFSPSSWHDIQVEQEGAAITVFVDGVRVVHFEDEEQPYLRGQIGLYTEDADVQFDALRVVSL